MCSRVGGVPTTGLDPKTNVVCKCEKVTEAEIVSAIHRSLPIDSTQAIRKRTRAGTYTGYYILHTHERRDQFLLVDVVLYLW